MWIYLLSGKLYGLFGIWMLWPSQMNNTEQEMSIRQKIETWQICRQTLFGQLLHRERELTVLGVCVAERLLAVCVAPMMVVELASVRGLILFDAELMVWSGTTQRETEEDTWSKNIHFSTNCTSPDKSSLSKTMTRKDSIWPQKGGLCHNEKKMKDTFYIFCNYKHFLYLKSNKDTSLKALCDSSKPQSKRRHVITAKLGHIFCKQLVDF